MFFFKKKKCTHPKVSPDKDAQYCPDCGEYIENNWYLTRCSCCNVKLVSIAKYDDIMPTTKFCPNCGCTHYYVQKIEKINFIDMYTKKKYGEGRRVFLMSPIHHHFQKKLIHESKITMRFVIISLLLAAISLVTLKIR